VEYASFLVGGHLFGIPVLLVQEISKPLELFPVPGHDPKVAGLVSLRGRTVVALDLRRFLVDDAATPLPKSRRFYVLEKEESLSREARELGLETHAETLVLVVDEAQGILDGEKLEFHPPPAHVREEFIEGVMKTEGRLMTLISVPRMVKDLLVREEESP
jgi:purine-binding chemotaxis protein CheW